MAHEFESGFFVKQAAWHTLGNLVKSAPTIEKGLKLAGLDWHVTTEGLRTLSGVDVSSIARVTIRSTDGKALGVVGPKYTPLQNAEAFDWFAPFIDNGECKLHTAGSLFEGRVVWILAEICRNPITIKTVNGKEEIKKFFLLSNSHDGTQAVRVKFTPIRVVCANTLGMAHNMDTPQMRIRHTKGVYTTLQEVRKLVNMVDQEFTANAELYATLAKCKINKTDLRNYVKLVLTGSAESKLSANQETVAADMISRAMDGYGQSPDSLSLWAAYNGVTEYYSYASNRNADNRVNSLWFGENAKLIEKALELAIALAA